MLSRDNRAYHSTEWIAMSPASRRRLLCMASLAVTVAVVPACVADGGSSAGARPTGLVTGDLNTINQADVADGGTATYTIFNPISNWNRLHANGSTYSVIDIASVIMPGVFTILPDGSLQLSKNLVEDAKVANNNPQTIVYRLRADAKWSDGQPVTADDFAYTWKVQDPDKCPECQAATTAGHEQIASVEGTDGGKTVTVVMEKPYSEWQQLFSSLLPAHVAKTYAPVDSPAGLAKGFNEAFATKAPTWSAGPFVIAESTPDGSVVMTRNGAWNGPRPHLEKLVFRLITDTTQQVTALQNHEVDVIYPTPQVDLVEQVKGLREVAYQVTPASHAHQMFLNLNSKPLQDRALRQAIITAIDAKEIIAKTIGQFDEKAEPLRSHLFVSNQPGYEDIHSARGYGAGDATAAANILRQAGYTGVGSKLVAPNGQPVPALRLPLRGGQRLTTDEAELIKNALRAIGVEVSIVTTNDLIAVARQGNWELALGNLNRSPFTATNQAPYYRTCPPGQNFCGFNLGNYGNAEVDKLFEQALTTSSADERMAHLRRVNVLIADDYAFLPLYQQRLLLAYRGDLANIRANSSDFPTYNSHEWGYVR